MFYIIEVSKIIILQRECVDTSIQGWCDSTWGGTVLRVVGLKPLFSFLFIECKFVLLAF
jgi:hypothetical protein